MSDSFNWSLQMSRWVWEEPDYKGTFSWSLRNVTNGSYLGLNLDLSFTKFKPGASRWNKPGKSIQIHYRDVGGTCNEVTASFCGADKHTAVLWSNCCNHSIISFLVSSCEGGNTRIFFTDEKARILENALYKYHKAETRCYLMRI